MVDPPPPPIYKKNHIIDCILLPAIGSIFLLTESRSLNENSRSKLFTRDHKFRLCRLGKLNTTGCTLWTNWQNSTRYDVQQPLSLTFCIAVPKVIHFHVIREEYCCDIGTSKKTAIVTTVDVCGQLAFPRSSLPLLSIEEPQLFLEFFRRLQSRWIIQEHAIRSSRIKDVTKWLFPV